jgi:DNA-binding PadR family transcriptional regulator/polyisoprenoid-binding protein YceI
MDETMAVAGGGSSRFELAPPRHFVLPAVLLLLSEHPGYGYALLAELQEFGFGHVDRPAVYRALAQLEQDGLVEESPSSQPSTAGQARRLYRTTSQGERTLRVWMGVIKDEHDCLSHVLRRYQATGTTDSVLAEVEGGWSSALGSGWSPVSSTSARRRHLVPIDTESNSGSDPTPRLAATGPGHYAVVPERSVVMLEARSTVGPLNFGVVGVTGSADATLIDGTLSIDHTISAVLDVDVSALSSGNSLYDAELLRRIDARRFPTASVKLRECRPSGSANRYRVAGEVTFHGVSGPAEGTISVEVVSRNRLVITGEQVLDIRDFALSSPTLLMLRIFPDVRVLLHVEASREEGR